MPRVLDATPEMMQKAKLAFNNTMHRLMKYLDKIWARTQVVNLFVYLVLCFTLPKICWEGYNNPLPDWVAALFAASICIVASAMSWLKPGFPINRFVIVTVELLLGLLLVHLTRGRIQTHFYFFIALSALAFYREYLLIAWADLVFVICIVSFSYISPQSMFGMDKFPPWWMWAEYAWWILLANFMLFCWCLWIRRDMIGRALVKIEREQEAEQRALRAAEQKANAESELATQQEKIVRVVRILTDCSEKITVALNELNSNVQQTLAVLETTSIAQQVRQTAELSRDKARNVAQESQLAMQTSAGGKSATVEAVNGIRTISAQMSAVKTSMAELTDKSRTIGEIIETVDEIARQTKMLSINAAIEAAKAGQYGSGFTVVANEIKQLSLQSTDATTRVRSILNDISRATARAVTTTDLGQDAVTAGEDVVVKARESIIKLAEGISKAAQAAIQIEVSNDQQLTGMEQVVDSMEGLKSVTNHTVKCFGEVEQAVNALNHLGRELPELFATVVDQSDQSAAKSQEKS